MRPIRLNCRNSEHAFPLVAAKSGTRALNFYSTFALFLSCFYRILSALDTSVGRGVCWGEVPAEMLSWLPCWCKGGGLEVEMYCRYFLPSLIIGNANSLPNKTDKLEILEKTFVYLPKSHLWLLLKLWTILHEVAARMSMISGDFNHVSLMDTVDVVRRCSLKMIEVILNNSDHPLHNTLMDQKHGIGGWLQKIQKILCSAIDFLDLDFTESVLSMRQQDLSSSKSENRE